MLRLQLSDSVEEFRSEFKTWLADNPPPKMASDLSFGEIVEIRRAWQKQLSDGGWVGVHWPKEFGGRGLSLVEEAVIQEELVRVNSPQLVGLLGLSMIGPVLIEHGTEEQQNAYLSKILTGDEIWCQGFSEPNAGSDLAAIKTKAEKVEGGFKITGQKVWTSFAHVANWCFLLARTSDEGKKHQGLTYMLVDMKEKGIETRPLRQITGDDEFNEVFFDQVFVPDENVVGTVGEGWKIAISTLMYERVILTFGRQLQSEVLLRHTLEKEPEDYEEELVKVVSEACAVRALAYSHLLSYVEGSKPGPEGSLDKLLWSESYQRITRLALAVNGPYGIVAEDDPNLGREAHRYLYSRGRTIAAGTSEIQRSIIANRVLDLPKAR